MHRMGSDLSFTLHNADTNIDVDVKYERTLRVTVADSGGIGQYEGPPPPHRRPGALKIGHEKIIAEGGRTDLVHPPSSFTMVLLGHCQCRAKTVAACCVKSQIIRVT